MTTSILDSSFDLEALCPATQRIITPIKLQPNDRLRISLTPDERSFDVTAYAIHPSSDNEWPASWAAQQTWVGRIPERRQTGSGRWTLRATDFAVLVIHATWPVDRIHFTSDATRLTYEYLLLRFLQQSYLAKQKAEFKLHGVRPPQPDNYFDHPNLPLTPYQETAAITTIESEGSALFMEQGTGKTPIVVRRIMHEAALKPGKQMYTVVIVCPKNVRTNWANELERFATVPGQCVVLRGGALHRIKQLIEVMEPENGSRWAAVICSYETIKRSWNAMRMIEWDLAVADESHFIKSPKAKRSQQLMKLRDHAKARMILTGTSVANNVSDLFSQLEFLGKGMSGFSNYTAFRQYYNRYSKKDMQGRREVLGYQNLPILQERLARCAYITTKREALPDLPQQTYDVREVSMSPRQAEYYEKVRRELAVEIEADLAQAQSQGKDLRLTVTNILTKLLRLSQITAGYVVSDKVYTSDGELEHGGDDRLHFFKNNPKLDELIDAIKEKGPLEKVIVWSCWVPAIRQIEQRLKDEGISAAVYYGGTRDDVRDDIVRRFNETAELKVFVGNPAAGGQGLNLPGFVPEWEGTEKDHGCNADHVFFYACDWSMIKRSQAEGRNHGKGRCRVPIRYTDLVVPNTIDVEIRKRVLSKQQTAANVQDVKEIMQRLVASDLEGD